MTPTVSVVVVALAPEPLIRTLGTHDALLSLISYLLSLISYLLSLSLIIIYIHKSVSDVACVRGDERRWLNHLLSSSLIISYHLLSFVCRDVCRFRTVSGAGIRSLDPANIQLRVDYYTNECGERNGTKGQQASTDAEASTGANLVVIVLSSVVIVGMVLFALSKSTRVRAIFARNPGGNEAESSVASKSTDEPNRVPTKPTRPVSVVIGPRPGAKINTVQMDWESTESPGFVPGHNYSGVGGGGSGLYTGKVSRPRAVPVRSSGSPLRRLPLLLRLSELAQVPS